MFVNTSCSKPADDSSEQEETIQTGPISEVVFSGDFTEIEAVPGQGNIVTPVTDAPVPTVALSSSGLPRGPAGDGNACIVRLSKGLSASLSGRKVTISIDFRSAPKDGSPLAKVMYSYPGAVTTSGWRDLKAGPEFQTAKFEYDVPKQVEGQPPDLISIWADPDAKGRAIEVRQITVESAAPF